ncbi:MAG: hypothetical protein ACRD88_04620 [Terriglobia bacterium]
MSVAAIKRIGLLGCALIVLPAAAQNPQGGPQAPHTAHPSGAGQEHAGTAGMPGPSIPMSATDMYLMQQVSGTATNPASSSEGMFLKRIGSWTTMLHGVVSLNEMQQTGPRGGDKFFASNWFMGMAQRRAGAGSFLARAMVSLEPATVTKRRYPLLLQTGETAFGRPIVDGQHPHDLVMELGIQYARPIGEKTVLGLYLAPVGDPTLGPVAFPHRISAQELPQAPLGHHVQDSSHIANEVITVGVTRGIVRLEASGFHGAEPNENRWNFDHGALDSWSSRLALSPAKNWSGQVSVGRLKRPEAHGPDDIVRSTASITYNKPLAMGFWASSFIWGRNHKTVALRNINSYLAESVLQFRQRNFLTGRVEWVDKDELLQNDHEASEHAGLAEGSVFRVAAFTLGYTRSLGTFSGIELRLGGNFTIYRIPDALQPLYGERPASALAHLRFRLKGRAGVHGVPGHAAASRSPGPPGPNVLQ